MTILDQCLTLSRNGSRQRRNHNWILIGIYTRRTQRCKFEWSWVTLSDNKFKLYGTCYIGQSPWPGGQQQQLLTIAEDESVSSLPFSTHSAVEMLHDSALYKSIIDIDIDIKLWQCGPIFKILSCTNWFVRTFSMYISQSFLPPLQLQCVDIAGQGELNVQFLNASIIIVHWSCLLYNSDIICMYVALQCSHVSHHVLHRYIAFVPHAIGILPGVSNKVR